MSLRVRLLGTIVGAIFLFFIFSVGAARLTLTRDLMNRGKTEVANGSSAFSGYWDSRKDQIRLLVAQDAVSDTLRKSLQARDVKSLQDQLANIERTSGLSFLTIVDTNGRVVARANGAAAGSYAGNAYVNRALTGETVTSAVLMPSADLQGEGLAAQAATDVTDSGKKVVEHVADGLALISAAPMSDANERTLGAIYGGVLLNHDYDLVDQSSRALGAQTAILEGDAVVSSTISEPDGTRVIDTRMAAFDPHAKSATAFVGADYEGGTSYLARIDPIVDDQNHVIGARWYGMPMSQITGITDHMTVSIILWGLAAMLVALLLAVPIVQRISGSIARRSEQVSAAAKELGVTIVGGEVSGDHVAATKQAVERAGRLIHELESGQSGEQIAELHAVNEELQGDMLVIDTLSQEMSNRLQQAVSRVSELNDVAAGLDKLVHGAPK